METVHRLNPECCYNYQQTSPAKVSSRLNCIFFMDSSVFVAGQVLSF